jgi:hypothetical protein
MVTFEGKDIDNAGPLAFGRKAPETKLLGGFDEALRSGFAIEI